DPAAVAEHFSALKAERGEPRDHPNYRRCGPGCRRVSCCSSTGHRSLDRRAQRSNSASTERMTGTENQRQASLKERASPREHAIASAEAQYRRDDRDLRHHCEPSEAPVQPERRARACDIDRTRGTVGVAEHDHIVNARPEHELGAAMSELDTDEQ